MSQTFSLVVIYVCSIAQSCPTLCGPMEHSPQGSSVHGIFQARILEWVPISSSRGSSQPRDWNCISCGSWIDRLPLWLSWSRICLQCGRPGFYPWVGKIPRRRERLPTPEFWPEEPHGLIVHWVAKSRTRLTFTSLHFTLLLYHWATWGTPKQWGHRGYSCETLNKKIHPLLWLPNLEIIVPCFIIVQSPFPYLISLTPHSGLWGK